MRPPPQDLVEGVAQALAQVRAALRQEEQPGRRLLEGGVARIGRGGAPRIAGALGVAEGQRRERADILRGPAQDPEAVHEEGAVELQRLLGVENGDEAGLHDAGAGGARVQHQDRAIGGGAPPGRIDQCGSQRRCVVASGTRPT